MYEKSWTSHYLIHKWWNNFMLVLGWKIQHMKCWEILQVILHIFLIWISTTSKSRGETNLRVSQSQVAEVEIWRHTPGFQLWKGVEGRVGSPGIRLGRGIIWSSLNLHQNKPPKWLDHFPGHPLVLGQATGTSDHKTHHCAHHQSLLFQHIHKSFLLCKRVRPRNHPLIAPKRVSRKSIAVLGAHLTFFYKNNRPIFQTCQNRRNSDSRYSKPSRTARFHQRTSGYLTFSNVFVDNGLFTPTKKWVSTCLMR
jgi:hypothetical protein